MCRRRERVDGALSVRARRAARLTASLTALTLALFSALGVGQEPLVSVSSATPERSRQGCVASSAKCSTIAGTAPTSTSCCCWATTFTAMASVVAFRKCSKRRSPTCCQAGVQFYAVLGNHDIRRGTDLQINYPGWNMAGRRFYAFSKGERPRRVLRARLDGPFRRGQIARDCRESGARRRARRARTQVTAHRR